MRLAKNTYLDKKKMKNRKRIHTGYVGQSVPYVTNGSGLSNFPSHKYLIFILKKITKFNQCFFRNTKTSKQQNHQNDIRPIRFGDVEHMHWLIKHTRYLFLFFIFSKSIPVIFFFRVKAYPLLPRLRFF